MHLARTSPDRPSAAWQRACVGLIARAGHALSLTHRLPLPDRAVLEQIILPHYARRSDIERILFVGCRWYTRAYAQLFEHAEYWTLERTPRQARYGARRHVIGLLEDVANHFPPGYFDLIVCNGVFGWGLNARAACERAFAQCHWALRDAGEFVLGWNDVPAHRPCDPLELNASEHFEPIAFAPLNGQRRFTVPHSNRHTYDFWRRPP